MISFKKIFAWFFLLVLLLTSTSVLAAETKLKDPLEAISGKKTGSEAVPFIVGNILKGVLGVVGVVALCYFIYGGFLWMTSAGNPEQVKKGKETFVWAIFGLVIVFFSYALVNFVVGVLTKGAAK